MKNELSPRGSNLTLEPWGQRLDSVSSLEYKDLFCFVIIFFKGSSVFVFNVSVNLRNAVILIIYGIFMACYMLHHIFSV